MQQSFDREPVIKALALPAADSSARAHVDVSGLVRHDELHPVELPRSAWSRAVEGLAIRPDEAERAVIKHLHHDPPFV